jgi:hypothetical protein
VFEYSASYPKAVLLTPLELERSATFPTAVLVLPVVFEYSAPFPEATLSDPKSVQQYGLIAEEVDKVYPELVIRDDTGKIQGVHYEELAPMLLSEVQVLQQKVRAEAAETAAQVRMIAAQAQKIDGQAAEIRQLRQQFAQLKDLNEATLAALRQTSDRDGHIAKR